MKVTFVNLALLILFVNSAYAQTFQYIYIEANEGSSSGGHVAVQFADEVFHYQYTGSLIRLVREPAEDFRFDYRYMQNRTLHIAEIEASEQTFNRLQSHFKQQFWDQNRQFKRLESIENDRLLLDWLQFIQTDSQSNVEPKVLTLPGAGLFYRNHDSKNLTGPCDTVASARSILNQLRDNVLQEYGDNFLSQRAHQLGLDIQNLRPNQTPLSDDSFSQRYIELLNGLLAVRVMLESRHLNSDACYVFNDMEWRLDAQTIIVLKKYQQHLLETAQTLLQATRPDWGQALFVVLARLLVVEQSLQSGQWTFLDDFASDAKSISTQTYNHQSKELASQRQAALDTWQNLWQSLPENDALDDLGYADLELAANRHREWQSSLETHSLRYQGQQTLPSKSLTVSNWIVPNLNLSQLQQAVLLLQTALPTLVTDIEQQYAYNLISRNCVTEIFRSINQALGDEIEQKVGSRIDPDLNFIPFAAFRYVQTHYPVLHTTVLPSFRMQEMTKQYQNNFAPWVYFRESNILSAELYHYNPDDALFIFFTDDSFFLRPVFGAFNTLTGLGQSLLGIFQLPVDQGATLQNGTRGLMMSLPELAFINIRKGSYKFDFSVNLSP